MDVVWGVVFQFIWEVSGAPFHWFAHHMSTMARTSLDRTEAWDLGAQSKPAGIQPFKLSVLPCGSKESELEPEFRHSSMSHGLLTTWINTPVAQIFNHLSVEVCLDCFQV